MGNQRKGGKPKQGLKVDNIDRSVLRIIRSVRKEIHLVPAIQEGRMSQLVEGLVKSGQHNNLMSILLEQSWESTTTAGIQMETLKESGATPLIQISDGTIALFPYVPTLRNN